jgi:hypothetical protein
MRQVLFEQVAVGMAKVKPSGLIAFLLAVGILAYIFHRALRSEAAFERVSLAVSSVAGASWLVLFAIRALVGDLFPWHDHSRRFLDAVMLSFFALAAAPLVLLKLIHWIQWLREPVVFFGGSGVAPDQLQTGDPVSTATVVVKADPASQVESPRSQVELPS